MLLNEADGEHEGNRRRRKVQRRRTSYTNITGLRILTRDPRPRRRKTTPRWGITEGDAEQISQGQREAKDTWKSNAKITDRQRITMLTIGCGERIIN